MLPPREWIKWTHLIFIAFQTSLPYLTLGLMTERSKSLHAVKFILLTPRSWLIFFFPFPITFFRCTSHLSSDANSLEEYYTCPTSNCLLRTFWTTTAHPHICLHSACYSICACWAVLVHLWKAGLVSRMQLYATWASTRNKDWLLRHQRARLPTSPLLSQ